MKILIEDYERRLKTINAELEKGGDEKKINRLVTKASCYRTFLTELNLALNIGDVSKPFIDGAEVQISDNTSGHGFATGEIVVVIDFEPNYSQWLCEGDSGKRWYINEHEGNVC